MKLLCDENVRRSIYNVLSQEGHDVLRVQDELDLGVADEEIVAFRRDDGRVLLTNDDDVFRFGDRPGILYLARQSAAPRSVAAAVRCIESLVGVDASAGQVLHVPGEWG